MKRNRIVLALAALALSLSIVACSSEATIKIGFIGPLTGEYAAYGETMSDAVALALEERNAANAIPGVKFVMIAEDSEGKPEKSKAAIEKLTSVDGIYGLVGDVFSGGSLAIRDTVQATKTVMISPSSSIKDLTAGYPFVFRTTGSDDLQAQVAGRVIAQELGAKTMAILYIKNDYSQALADGVKAVFEAAGGTVVAVEAGQPNDKDFKTQLTNIKTLNPDVIYIPNYAAEMAQMLEQANQLGITSKFVSADGFSNPDILTLAGQFAEGVFFTGNPQETASTTATTFAAAYKAKYNIDADDFSKNSYDAANILVDAIIVAYNAASQEDRSKLNLDRDTILATVASTMDYDGASGRVTFDQNGDPLKNVGFFTVQGGKFVQTSVFTVDNGTLVKVQ